MIRSFLVYLPSTVMPRLTAFLTIIIGTRLLVPSEYGMFSLVAVIGEFSDMAFTNWVRITLSRFGARTEGLSVEFARRMGRLAIMCTAVAVLSATLVSRVLAPERFWQVSLALCAYVTASGVARFGIALHQGMQAHRRASTFEATRAVVTFGATIAVMASTRHFLYASLAASVANVFIGTIATYVGFRAASRVGADDTTLRTILMFAAPLIVLAFLAQAIASLDKALLKHSQDAATLGYYTAAFSVGRSGFDAAALAFNIGAYVRLSALFNAGQRESARVLLSRQLAYIPAVVVPTAGFLVASRALIADVLFPAPYHPTFVKVIPFVACGAIAINLKSFVFDNIFHMHLRNVRQIPTLVTGACVSVGTAYFLFSADATLGAGAMFAAGAVTALVMSIALSRTLMRLDVDVPALAMSLLVGASVWITGSVMTHVRSTSIPAKLLLALLAVSGLMGVAASLFLVHLHITLRDKRRATRA